MLNHPIYADIIVVKDTTKSKESTVTINPWDFLPSPLEMVVTIAVKSTIRHKITANKVMLQSGFPASGIPTMSSIQKKVMLQSLGFLPKPSSIFLVSPRIECFLPLQALDLHNLQTKIEDHLYLGLFIH